MDYDDLTNRQKEILAYIIDYQRQQGISPTVREIAGHFKVASPGGIHRILNVLREKGYLHADPAKKRSWRPTVVSPTVGGIPLVGTIAAGEPIEAIEHIEEELAIAPSVFGYESCFALRVKGDSMIEAHITDGDLAIIRKQHKVPNGGIAAVMVEDVLDEATLKIVKYSATAVTLKPANRRYKEMAFRGNARRKVRIIGKLVGVVRRQ